MTDYTSREIGHVIVKIPIRRNLEPDVDSGEPHVWFEFDSYQFLSERLDPEYLNAMLGLLGTDGLAQTLLNYIDQADMWSEFKEALEARVRDLKRVP